MFTVLSFVAFSCQNVCIIYVPNENSFWKRTTFFSLKQAMFRQQQIQIFCCTQTKSFKL